MSGERIVTIRIDDPKVTALRVHPYRELREHPGSGEFIGWNWVSAPPTDQATRDLTEALRIVESSGWSHRHELAARLRAWAGLDEGSETT